MAKQQKPPKPTPMKKNLECARYGSCLTTAIQKGWAAWSCAKCPYRNIKTKTRPPGRRPADEVQDFVPETQYQSELEHLEGAMDPLGELLPEEVPISGQGKRLHSAVKRYTSDRYSQEELRRLVLSESDPQ